MRIGIDVRSTLKRRTGIGQYTLNLVNHLAKIDQKNEYFLYSKKRLFDRKRKLPKLTGKNFSHIVDRFSKGPAGVMKGIDIFHSSSFDLVKPKDSKLILTIHDVIIKSYPQGHTRETIENIDSQLKNILGKVDTIIADSYSAKNDLLKWYDVDSNRISVVYPGINDCFYPEPSDERKCLLFVGTIEPRKNVEGLIKAFAILKSDFSIKEKLVIVGMKGWMYDSVFNLVDQLNLKSDIFFTGYVPDEELRHWYNSALVFIYPSFYEGFGFPIMEAFRCGVPVVTSNISSCAEIANGAAILIDPDEPNEIAEAIMKIINDRGLRESLGKKGLERSREFTWDKTVKRVLEIFEKVYKQ